MLTFYSEINLYIYQPVLLTSPSHPQDFFDHAYQHLTRLIDDRRMINHANDSLSKPDNLIVNVLFDTLCLFVLLNFLQETWISNCGYLQLLDESLHSPLICEILLIHTCYEQIIQ